MKTMIVVTMVSFRVGHVTFAVSARTCCINSNGLVFAISEFKNLCDLRQHTALQSIQLIADPSLHWQEWRDSNPQPPVLETGALAD
jgi:hypothetical protein